MYLRFLMIATLTGLLITLAAGQQPEPLAAIHVPSGQTSPVPQPEILVTSITIPTHPVEQALTYHFNPVYNMFYARLDRNRYDSQRLEARTYTLLVIENQYLRLTFLPQLGGRLYQAIFKPTGNNIFYQNPVIKPSPWGPPEMGWWLAVGGLEWGLPVEEHGYEWGVPWNYQITPLPDGVRVELWDTRASNRLQARIAVTLPNEAAYFQITPTLQNPTDRPIEYKFWLNGMLAPGPANQISPQLRIIIPTDQVTVHSTGDARLPEPGAPAGWPIHNGVDWSRISNWREWYGFFQRPQAAGGFQAIYDEGFDEGVVRTYDSQVAQGAKFFAFGFGPQALPADLYTDDQSSYVEMHGGLAPTFADSHRLAPGATISWDERWYPVAGLGSLTWANSQLALYLEEAGENIRLHLVTPQPRQNVRLVLLQQTDHQILFQADRLVIAPDQPYHSPWLHLPALDRQDFSILVYGEEGLLASYEE